MSENVLVNIGIDKNGPQFRVEGCAQHRIGKYSSNIDESNTLYIRFAHAACSWTTTCSSIIEIFCPNSTLSK